MKLEEAFKTSESGLQKHGTESEVLLFFSGLYAFMVDLSPQPQRLYFLLLY